MNILYISSFALKYYVFFEVSVVRSISRRTSSSLQVTFARQALQKDSFLVNAGQIYNLSRSEQYKVYQTCYWLNAGQFVLSSPPLLRAEIVSDRFYWVSLDPVNVAEGLFAIAKIFSFSRICFLLPAFQHLGPLQISLGRMMSVSGDKGGHVDRFFERSLGHRQIHHHLFDHFLRLYVRSE